jgi:hypothetical protein
VQLLAEVTCLDEIACGGNLRAFHRSAHCIRNLKVQRALGYANLKVQSRQGVGEMGGWVDGELLTANR